MAKISGITAALVGLLLIGFCAPSRAAQARGTLDANSLILVSRAIADHAGTVTLEIATRLGSTYSVAQQFRTKGATVERLDVDIGYLRIAIAPERVEGLLRLANIEAVAVFSSNQSDFSLPAGPTSPEYSLAVSRPVSPFNLNHPGVQYTGAPAMGADRFVSRHPTFDGRGVTIAIDEPADPQAPGLRTAYTLSGKAVRKVADFGVIDSPFLDEVGSGPLGVYYGWVDMRTLVHSVRGSVWFRGHRYRVPYDGTFNIGVFWGDRWIATGLGVVQYPPPEIPVLWDKRTGHIWFDAGERQAFIGPPISDYAVSGDVAELPVAFSEDEIAGHVKTRGRAALHYVVKAKPQIGFLKVIQLDNYHANMVASSAAGNGMLGGRINGIAPGARVLCVVNDLPQLMLESILWAVHHHAEIVLFEVGVHFHMDGQGAREVWKIIIGRIIARYHTVLVWPAYNSGPAIQSVYSPADFMSGFGIGGYLSRKNQRLDANINFQGEPVYSSRGPALDGSLAPVLLAPTEWLADGNRIIGGSLIGGKWRLPRGYMVGGGTSQAAPTAAGAIALLISAARQRGIPHDVSSLRRALLTTARKVEGLPIDQGFGVINVPDAFRILTSGEESVKVRVDGLPLFDRDVPAGLAGTYSFRAIASQNTRVRAVWVGSRGGRVIRPTIKLTQGPWTPVEVRLSPLSSGELRSGIVEMRALNSGLLLASRAVTQVSPLHFTSSHDYTIAVHGTLQHPGYLRYFISVPAGVSVLSIHLKEKATGPGWKRRVREAILKANPMRIVEPDGNWSYVTSGGAHTPASDTGYWETAIASPRSGVWQIILFGGDSNLGRGLAGAGAVPSSPVIMHVAVYGVSKRACKRVPFGTRCAFENRFAPFRTTPADVPAFHRQRVQLKLRAANPYSETEIQLRPGATDLRVTFSGNQKSELSANLFHCVKHPQGPPWYRGACFFWAHSSAGVALDSLRPTGGAVLDATIPEPGRWVVVAYASNPSLRKQVNVTGIIELSYGGAGRAVTTVSVGKVGIGERFDAIVRSTVPGQVPSIISPDVVEKYHPYVWVSNRQKYLPVVTQEVPIFR